MYKFRYVEMGTGLHWQPRVRKPSYFVYSVSNFLNASELPEVKAMYARPQEIGKII
jgi:hypothetical protein